MPLLEPAILLEDIERSLAASQRFIAGVTLDTYLANEEKRAAVERMLEIAGEALTRLLKIAPALSQRIPEHRSIIAFRNVLAHGYAELDHTKVYEVAHFKAPQLLATVRELLQEADEAGP